MLLFQCPTRFMPYVSCGGNPDTNAIESRHEDDARLEIRV